MKRGANDPHRSHVPFPKTPDQAFSQQRHRSYSRLYPPAPSLLTHQVSGPSLRSLVSLLPEVSGLPSLRSLLPPCLLELVSSVPPGCGAQEPKRRVAGGSGHVDTVVTEGGSSLVAALERLRTAGEFTP
ncbi:unnamed protein product [Arctogadus glacialis]